MDANKVGRGWNEPPVSSQPIMLSASHSGPCTAASLVSMSACRNPPGITMLAAAHASLSLPQEVKHPPCSAASLDAKGRRQKLAFAAKPADSAK
eukprot:5555561-Amphidinium_carterae.1